MGGLLIASFLCYFIGFIGPFAFVGGICVLITIFMNQLIDFNLSKVDTKSMSVINDGFSPKADENEQMLKNSNKEVDLS